ncbi:putative membrane protein [Sphingomonas jejuensis]|uniref:Membrane protein n=1 Tax=Sphingomonas jejuensis TaxID=904715 RepID=A0ABX0XIE5_9SPHN|nr:SRPBCC family protein [Sphingomonas jejuensis]NJC32933.1 putative membrane protein [Sphingomonas jejuensis]
MNDTDGVRSDDAPAGTAKSDAADKVGAGLPEQAGDSATVQTVTINKPRQELYSYFRDFSNLPAFMDNVERIEVKDRQLSHWVVKAPAGATVEWDARVTEDRDGELIAWTSEAGADVPNSGRVEFRDASGGRGTVVSATILYDPPAGVVGKLVAKIFQREPAIQARRDLRRFKQLMETGEIATNAMNPAQAREKEQG